MNTTFKLPIVLVAWLTTLSLSASMAFACPREESVEKGFSDLGSYSDVTSALDCKNPKRLYEKLICKNPKLIRLSELDARAQVFALENAMCQEVNHKRFKDQDFEQRTLAGCKDEACICSALADHILSAFPEFNP